MIDRAEILRLIPHQGAMCLWDEVLAWDARTIQLRARNHRDPTHPLRASDCLRAVHLCEYGPQATAVHGGLRARDSSVRAPARADASAASVPAWPPPITITS